MTHKLTFWTFSLNFADYRQRQPMKIALIGYGKMGHAIEEAALKRGHQISVRIDRDNLDDFDSPEFFSSDIAIEFTTPATAADNCLASMERGVGVICGSTGWNDRVPVVEEACRQMNSTFMWSSNYSIGVNLFFAVNRVLATLMNSFAQYTPSMHEVHHIHKLDHPSGTAVSLAGDIISHTERIHSWSEDDKSEGVLNIEAERRGEVPGIHSISWTSDVDSITITHDAKSRGGFALGAVLAAEWAATRKGVLSMQQMMKGMVNRPELDFLF